MTMDLSASHGEDRFTHDGWTHLLKMALQYGWQPAGTTPSDEPEEPDEWNELDELEAAPPEGADDFSCPAEVPPAPPIADLMESLSEEKKQRLRRLLAQIEQDDQFFAQWPRVETYFGNDGSKVHPEDARALADALERGLPDIPNHDAMETKTFALPGLPPGVGCLRDDVDISPLEFYSGKNKKGLQDFMAFCRQGGFAIW